MSTGEQFRSVSFLPDSRAAVDGATAKQEEDHLTTLDTDEPGTTVELSAGASQVIVLGGVSYEVGLSDPE